MPQQSWTPLHDSERALSDLGLLKAAGFEDGVSVCVLRVCLYFQTHSPNRKLFVAPRVTLGECVSQLRCISQTLF